MTHVRIINLTNHEVKVMRPDGTEEVFEPSGQVARVEYKFEKTYLLGLPVQTTRVLEIVGLPAPRKDMIFIVSTRVRVTHPDRTDLLSPAELVRDRNMNVIGCRSLERNPIAQGV